MNESAEFLAAMLYYGTTAKVKKFHHWLILAVAQSKSNLNLGLDVSQSWVKLKSFGHSAKPTPKTNVYLLVGLMAAHKLHPCSTCVTFSSYSWRTVVKTSIVTTEEQRRQLADTSSH